MAILLGDGYKAIISYTANYRLVFAQIVIKSIFILCIIYL